MQQVLVIVFTAFLASTALAQDSGTTAATPDPVAATSPVAEDGAPAPEEAAPKELVPLNAADVSLEDFLWIKRPVVVFADTPADPRFREQMDLLAARPAELLDRDVVVIFDTDPKQKSAIRSKLRPRGFMLTLIAKDGGIVLRKPFPWDVRELSRSIDKLPLREQELNDAKAKAEAAALSKETK
jgi:hypothetical protein